jgi:hypothetical protein
LTIYVVDIADPSAPRAVGRLPLPAALGEEYFTGVIQTDNALLVGRVRYESPAYPPSDKAGPGTGSPSAGAPSPAGVSPDVPRLFYDIIELGDPAAPTIATRFEIPGYAGQNGWGQLVQHPAVDLRAISDDVYDDRLYALGDRAFELANRRMTVLGTRDPAAPTQQVHELPDSDCESFDVAGDTLYCATGTRGVEVIDLSATR